MYIGETSHPWHKRITELKQGMEKFELDSVFIQHGMSEHGLETTYLEISCYLVRCYKDPLQFQTTVR